MKDTVRTFSFVLTLVAAVVVIAGGALYLDEPALYAGPDQLAEPAPPSATAGPLSLRPQNSRYFTDASGRPVYLTGSHTWNNLQDIGRTDPPAPFDFDEYLRFMRQHRHNFIRLWRWETSQLTVREWNTVLFIATHPWERNGGQPALDGKPQFDLSQFNQAYFNRMRARVQAAGANGIYVSVMLFEGWAQQFAPDGYQAHPFNGRNNVNGIDCDTNRDNKGLECFTLETPAVTEVQEAYVRKVIDTVNDLDNVLFEVSNENHSGSHDWELHFLRYVRDYERGKPKQHPVGLGSNGGGARDDTGRLLASGADWISPNGLGRPYQTHPPAATGSSVIIIDTDHLWGLGGDRSWVWKSFLRGLNPIFMDPYKEQMLVLETDEERQQWESVRRAMGHTAWFASRLDLDRATPRPELASSGYVLADPGVEYLVYMPLDPHPSESATFLQRFQRPIRNFRANFAQEVGVDLSARAGAYLVEWFNPSSGETITAEPVVGGGMLSFVAPFAGDAVLYLKLRP